MKWSDLVKGDVVVPINPDANPWLILEAGQNERGEHQITYVNLGTATVNISTNGSPKYNSKVIVLRGTENVNR